MGTKQNWAKSEREALCDLFESVGPDAPTLCEGWDAKDLAAHLVIREARPDASIGIVIKPFERWTERVQDRAAQGEFADLVDKVRNGPPALSFFSVPGVDVQANTFEYFVHHEDVRRRQPDWQPRQLAPEFADDLWKRMKMQSKGLLRNAATGVVLERSDTGARITAKKGEPSVTLVGEVSELVMFAFGRKDASHVDVLGAPEAVSKFNGSQLGI